MSSDKPRTEHNLEAGVKDTFPASDPVASGMQSGSRAVDLGVVELPPYAPPVDSVTVGRDFAQAEAAKLALETMVRNGPIDRRSAEIGETAQGATLKILAEPSDAERLQALLDSAPG